MHLQASNRVGEEYRQRRAHSIRDEDCHSLFIRGSAIDLVLGTRVSHYVLDSSGLVCSSFEDRSHSGPNLSGIAGSH